MDYNGGNKKNIHAYSAIFKYNQVYSGIRYIEVYSFKHIQNPVQPWHI